MQRYYGTLIKNGKPITGIWFTDGVNLTFNKRSAGFVVMFGMLSDTISIGKQVLTLPISDIKSIEYFKFRLNKKALRLHTENDIIEMVCKKPEKMYTMVAGKIR